MSDETETQTTAPQDDTQAPEPQATETIPETTFTQADVDRIIADRLARVEKQQKDAAAKAKAAAEREKMDAEQRAKSEKEEAEKERDEALSRAKSANYRADLKGEVIDVKAALKLIDDEKHVNDGAVDVKALLKDYPFLKANQTTSPSAGGVQTGAARGAPNSFAEALERDGIKI